jgi:hypothetical protein
MGEFEVSDAQYGCLADVDVFQIIGGRDKKWNAWIWTVYRKLPAIVPRAREIMGHSTIATRMLA